MKTRTEYAAYIEFGDFIVVEGEVKGQIIDVDDSADILTFEVKDDEGYADLMRFAPFDEITIVEVFDDEEIVIEDIEED